MFRPRCLFLGKLSGKTNQRQVWSPLLKSTNKSPPNLINQKNPVASSEKYSVPITEVSSKRAAKNRFYSSQISEFSVYPSAILHQDSDRLETRKLIPADGVLGVGAGDLGVGDGNFGVRARVLGVGAGELGVGAGDLGVGAGELGVGAADLAGGHGNLGVSAGDLGVGDGNFGVRARVLGVGAGDLGVGAADIGGGHGNLGVSAGDHGDLGVRARVLGVGAGGTAGPVHPVEVVVPVHNVLKFVKLGAARSAARDVHAVEAVPDHSVLLGEGKLKGTHVAGSTRGGSRTGNVLLSAEIAFLMSSNSSLFWSKSTVSGFFDFEQNKEQGNENDKHTLLGIFPLLAVASGSSVENGNEGEAPDSELNDHNSNKEPMETNDEVTIDSDLEEETNSQASKKRKSEDETNQNVSPVWRFATKVSPQLAKCNVCNKTYTTPKSNTSNIRDHIINKHADKKEGKELKELIDKRRDDQKRKKEKASELKEQQSIKSFFPSDRQVSTATKTTIDDAVVEYFIAGNQAFKKVENYFFRKMCFKMNSGYVLPTRMALSRKIDTKIVQVKEDLTKEIKEDIKNHKSIHITSDGGNSGDQNKTKKNTLTVSRINDKWEMKTDTVALPEAVGSQSGIVLRNQWREELEKIGYDKSWSVSATTDAAKNERSARGIGRHDEIGLDIKYEADCVDHQIQLLAKDSRKNIEGLKEALKKGRKLCCHFSKSTLSRQLLVSIQKELKLPVKWIIVGTKNRWFHEMSEAERLVELRASIEEFQERRAPGDGRRRRAEEEEEDDEDLVVPQKLVDEDFRWLEIYVKAMKPFTAISKFLSGERYPTAGCVIPALEQIKEDISKQKDEESDPEAHELLEKILSNLGKRFKDNWKMKSPFNCLTFLDPRFVDLYCFEEAVFKKMRNDLVFDSVYTEDAQNHPLPEPSPSPSSFSAGSQEDRRTQLLKRKLAQSAAQQDLGTFEARVDVEINRYKETTPIDMSQNPLAWWKMNESVYPLLSKFVMANAAFQATSVASERIYNVDKLVYDDRRKSLDIERGSGLVVTQDYLKRRINKAEFELCPDCPAPQSQFQSKYRVTCTAHNKK